MTNVIVTGGSGLVGRHLLPLLGDAIAPVRSQLDLSQPLDLGALPGAADAVVYLAQSSRFREWPNDNGDIHQVNVAAPLALAEYARRAGARHFIYASTGGVYAQSASPISEGGELAQPMSFYPASKYAAETLLAPYAAHFTLVILRFFFVYGPGARSDMLIPRLIESVRDGRSIQLQGQDGLRLNPIHAGDAANAIVAALGLHQSMTINVAGPEQSTLRAIAEQVGTELNREPLFEIEQVDGSGIVADIGRMTRLLGKPTIGIASGLRTMLA